MKSNMEGCAHLLSVCTNQTHVPNTRLTIFTGIHKIFISNPRQIPSVTPQVIVMFLCFCSPQ